MRPSPLLVLLASLPLATGCQLGGKSAGLQADATPRKKEVWSAPRFGRGNDERRARHDESLNRAHAAARDGRLVEAKLLYARVLDEDSRSAGAHHGLAILADRQQDYVNAETHYLKALELRPEDADLLNDVGYSYLLQERFSEAQQLFVRALEVDPRHELATSNLGHLHAQNGRFEKALTLFRRVGTEEQAQAEIARYTRRQAPADREEFAEWAAEPGPSTEESLTPDDLRGLSFEQMQAVRERARLDAIRARRERERAESRSFDEAPAIQPDERTIAADPREAPPFDPGFENFADQPGNRVQPVGFESIDPTPLEVAAPTPPVEPFGRGANSDFGAPPSQPDPATEFAAPDSYYWPPANSRPADGSLAGGNPNANAPPWPGTNGQRMGDRMTTAMQPRMQPVGNDPGPVIRPSPIRQRAAILGMNAGSGLPIPIESAGTRTANRRAFETPAQPRPTPARQPAAPATRPPASSTNDRFGAPELPEQWPASAGRESQPVSTTAIIPSDASLYRTATGAPLDADARMASHYAPAERHGRIEDWPHLRRDLNDLERSYQSNRSALDSGVASHPGFPADFGPPTTQPRPRPSADDSSTGW